MQLLLVGDGETDKTVIPHMVRRVLGKEVEVTDFSPWKKIRLNAGSGYGRKLRYAMARARDRQRDGLVATVDCDKAKRRSRLTQMRDSRNEDRRDAALSPLPTALGEAVPHLEAWLLDDEKAVRETLLLPADKGVPNVTKVDPKKALNDLMDECGRIEAHLTLLGEIAQCVEVSRCNHKSKTGLEEFVQDVRAELV